MNESQDQINLLKKIEKHTRTMSAIMLIGFTLGVLGSLIWLLLFILNVKTF